MLVLESTPPRRGQHFIDIVEFAKCVMSAASEEDIAFAEATDFDSAGPLIEYVLEHKLVSSESEIWRALRGSKYTEFMRFVMDLKKTYDVPRPFVLAWAQGERLPFEYDSLTTGSASYPSGHAAEARFLAHFLSNEYVGDDEYSDVHRCELFNIANRIAWGRVILGVHSIQDIREGKRLADCLFLAT